MPRPRHPALTYIDTSVWCAYCFNEPEAPEAVQWLAQAELDRAAISPWVYTEFASASAIKQRLKGQTSAVIERARQAFEAAVVMAQPLQLTQDDFLQAADLCTARGLRLRAGDALHLAVALRHRCRALATLDQDMTTVARHLGLEPTVF